MDSDTATESDISLKSHSFLNRVNDRLRKMLKRSPEDSMKDIVKRSMIWGMFMSSTVEESVFMGKIGSENLHSIKNTWENLILQKMIEESEQLILEQSDEIFGVSQISWESSPWKQFALVNEEKVISLSHAKVHVFSDSVLYLGKMNQNPASNTVWVQRFITKQNFGHNRRRTDGIRVEYFPGFNTLELVREFQKFMSKMCEPEQFQGRVIFMSMFNDIICGNKDNEQECIANSTLVSLFAKRFPAGRWHSSDPDQKQSGNPPTMKDLEENGTKSLN